MGCASSRPVAVTPEAEEHVQTSSPSPKGAKVAPSPQSQVTAQRIAGGTSSSSSSTSSSPLNNNNASSPTKETSASASQQTTTSSVSAASSSSSSSSAAAGTTTTSNAGSHQVHQSADTHIAMALHQKRRHGILRDATSPLQHDAANYVKKVVPKTKEVREMIASALGGNPLFGNYGTTAIEDMIDAMEQRHVSAGTTIITQGESGDNFYVIENGKFDILVGERKVADWGDGTNNRTVGEYALLYGAPRAATVRATTDAHVWYIDRATFRNVTAHSAIAEHQQLKAALRKGILEELSDEQLDKVAAAANRVRFAEGAQIIKKGDVGKVFYIIETGGVICEDLPGAQSSLHLGPGTFFGERALIKQEPRACNVFASTDASLITLSREDFESLLGDIEHLIEKNTTERLLTCVPILQKMDVTHRTALAAHVKTQKFQAGSRIVSQDERISRFFLVKEGEVTVSMLIKDVGSTSAAAAAEAASSREKLKAKLRPVGTTTSSSSSEGPQEEVLGKLVAGQWFGEDEITSGSNSCAIYTATTNGECFSVDRETFLSVIAPYIHASTVVSSSGAAPQQHTRDGASSSAHSNVGMSQHISADTDAEDAGGAGAAPRQHRGRLGIPFEELELGATLGTGNFGRVRLAFHRKTNRVFALKMLKKAQIVALGQQANIMNEKELLWKVDHPFVIRLYDTYKDQDRLYMLLELVQGGELFARLQNAPTPGRVSPADARFYAGCVLDAFEHLHGLSIVYRDLKPENLLIDAEGYMKIVDFGFAKIVKDRTLTTCGTPEYMSPELILGTGHNKGADYWALGILLFEQVAGYSPFADLERNDQLTIAKNILKGEFTFPPHFKDPELKDLIRKLLVKDVTKRLGCMKGGAQDVKDHPFFAQHLSFSALRERRVEAPWVPDIQDPFDTRHFDEYDDEEEVPPYDNKGDEWDKYF